jgi:hypothetical protein
MNFANLYNDPTDSDIKIKVGDKLIHAHKVFLKNGSAMLKGGLSTYMKEYSTGVFEFPDRDPTAVETAIKWMYGVDISASYSAGEYVEMLSIAHYLQMDALLKKLLNGFIPNDILISELIQLAYLYDSETLYARIVSRCQQRSKTVDDRITVAKELAELDIDEYTEFRNHCINDKLPTFTLFLYDCHYTAANSETQSEAMEIMNRFISNIMFDKMDEQCLALCLDLPVVRDSPIFTHMLLCISRNQISRVKVDKKNAAYGKIPTTHIEYEEDQDELYAMLDNLQTALGD